MITLESFCFYFTLLIVLRYCIRLNSFWWYMIKTYVLSKFNNQKDLKTYGQWAVVTGSTDGIGKCYAEELAMLGFDIVLISRTKQKLERISNEITQKYGVKTLIVVFDFSEGQGYEKLKNELHNLDIGILVNNVGMSYDVRQFFDILDMNEIKRMAQVNMFSDLHLTHFILPGMLKRKRGVIIHVSSCFSFYPSALLSIYPATKVFLNSYVKGLQLEVESQPNIHHQLVTPNFVCSNMTKATPSLFVPTAKDYTESAVRTIGIVEETCGYWSHEFIALLLKYASHDFVERMFLQWIRCDRFKERSFAQKEL